MLVLGGRSEIGLAVATRLVGGGTARTVVLAARRSGDLDAAEAQLRAAGAGHVARVEFHADAVATHQDVLGEIAARHGPLDVVVTAAHAPAVAHKGYSRKSAC